MARSIDPVVHAVRGFVPARTDEERFLMRHIEDLARTAQSRGIARYSGFLSDREQELARAALGRAGLATRLLAPDEVPEFRTAERRKCTATVSSLRLDAVLAAMLRCSRGQASELVTAGRVEINHLPAEKPSAPVYEGDVFTVRGKGRFALTALPGKSKKERLIIEFFQY